MEARSPALAGRSALPPPCGGQTINTMLKKPTSTSLFQKIVFSVGGFLIGMLVIMLFLKIFSSVWGTIIGIIINTAFFAYIFKNKEKQKDKIIIAYGILAATIFTVIAGTGLWIFIEIAFRDIAS
jgi:hypothetical protein